MFHTGIREFANGSEAGNGVRVYGMALKVGLSMKEPANHQCKVHHLEIKRGDFLFINVTNTQPGLYLECITNSDRQGKPPH